MNYTQFLAGVWSLPVIWIVGSGIYVTSRNKAQDFANRWMRAENARIQKELNKQRDALIKRQLRDDEIINAYIEKKVRESIKKETAKS